MAAMRRSAADRARLAAGAALVAAAVLAAGCDSPEARRIRGGGPGADPGNVGEVVRMHDGAEPYYATPCLGEAGVACAEPAATARSGSQ